VLAFAFVAKSTRIWSQHPGSDDVIIARQ
jgi:hypothetical protein